MTMESTEAGRPLGLACNEGLGARWLPFAAGGRCPLEAGARFDAQHRDGKVTANRIANYNDRWDHYGTPCDIVAYRVTG
jgi:hypothetical protein